MIDVTTLLPLAVKGGNPGDGGGLYFMRCPSSRMTLKVIASWEMGWDHVSASLKNRTPLWEEMAWLRDTFFEPEECVMQLHPPHSAYINNHPYCLHLWRPQNAVIPMPEPWMVGIKELNIKG